MPRKSSEFHVSSHLIPPNVPPIVHTSLAGHILLHKMGRGWQLPLEQGWPARLNTQTTHTHMHAYTMHLQHICLHTWPTIKSRFILPPLSHLHICSPHMCSSSVQSLPAKYLKQRVYCGQLDEQVGHKQAQLREASEREERMEKEERLQLAKE